MNHQIAKVLLQQAKTFRSRSEAVSAAMELRMPLNEIEMYLDWLDSLSDDAPESDEGPLSDR
ncbi:MAG TPA: hypothetical protein DCY79_18460 [Planctomycetaceae bacterium]|nr:hypothetical protein [Blastopirellula sp.]HAY81792.1 hypothetical protein [Planctomycetaceae bacterium]